MGFTFTILELILLGTMYNHGKDILKIVYVFTFILTLPHFNNYMFTSIIMFWCILLGLFRN